MRRSTGAHPFSASDRVGGLRQYRSGIGEISWQYRGNIGTLSISIAPLLADLSDIR